MLNYLRDRTRIMYLVIFLIGAVFAARLIMLQIVQGASYNDKAYTRLMENSRITAPRGEILDRNGVVIATNREGYSLRLSWVSMTSDDKNMMFFKLIDILVRNGDRYKDFISDYLLCDPVRFGPKLAEDPSALEEWKTTIWDKKTNMSAINTPEEIFAYMRDNLFQLPKGLSDIEAYRLLNLKYGILINSYYNINPFADDISRETVAELTERKAEFPAVSIENVPYRVYYDSEYIAHVLGYIGKLTEEEYKANASKGYILNDYIGKDGVELTLENYLRGHNGFNIIQRNELGQVVKTYIGDKAVPGKDIVLTIDMKLQKVAMEALKRSIEEIKSHVNEATNFRDAFAGAAVALDVNTGEILAMVSYPSYDPSVFLLDTPEARKTKNEWLTDGYNIPMYNRAISGIYAPGSTFKPITALAALEAGKLDPYAYFSDPGIITIDNMTFQDVGAASHGSLNLENALAQSCNIYFGSLGMETGIDQIDLWAKKFGLGELTNIQLPGEVPGVRSNRESKWAIWQEPWGRMDTAQTAIGQFSQAFTPLQMANYASTIGNGGRRYTPLIIKSILNPDGTVYETDEAKVKFEDIGAEGHWMDIIKKGMVQVLKQYDNYASLPFLDLKFEVAGKTGTAETGYENQSSNALFISYAPAEKPQIAIAVVIEKGVWGAYCSPVAGDIIKEYFRTRGIAVSDEDIVTGKAIFTK